MPSSSAVRCSTSSPSSSRKTAMAAPRRCAGGLNSAEWPRAYRIPLEIERASLDCSRLNGARARDQVLLLMPSTIPPHPCKSDRAASGKISDAVAMGRPAHPGALKPAAQRGSSIVGPLNPDSRVGRSASPVEQGRVRMDAYVGIDVSKDRLDVHVEPSGESFAVARDGEGLAGLIERLQPLAPRLIAIEATGGFEIVVAAAIGGAGLPLAVVNPAQVRHYAQALGKRAKTDTIDAAVIARFAEATKPEVRPLPDEATRLLADLVARRRQIVVMIGAERQRAKRMPRRLQKSCERVIRVLE